MSSFRMPTNLTQARIYVDVHGDTQLGMICKMFFAELDARDKALAWYEAQRAGSPAHESAVPAAVTYNRRTFT